MPWRIVDGQPVRYNRHPVAPVPEVTPRADTPTTDDILMCPYCEKDYKTETGLDRHISSKH